MNLISELLDILNGHFNWNKSRMICFDNIVLGLIKVRTVNLVELACAYGGAAKLDSRYKRIKRFFSQCEIDFAGVASWVIQLFNLLDKPFYLSMDRTNWRWGKSDINIFMFK